jgi:hypothetical protein
MGYVKHNAIIVTSWDEKIKKVHAKALSIFDGDLVSEIVFGKTNGERGFFITPDGSKEGWDTSEECDVSRKSFLDWLRDSDYCCDYIEVRFGGDDDSETIVRSKRRDLNELGGFGSWNK